MKNQNECLIKINDIYPSLGKAPKKVAEYILANPDRVIKMSITDLAASCGVSEYTVNKFCKQLSFSGYADFKIELAKESSASTGFLTDIHEKIEINDRPLDIASKVCTSHIQALQSTLKYQHQETLSEAIEVLTRAKKILFLGLAGSFRVAYDAEHKFFKLGIECRAIADPHMQAMYSSLLEPSDAVVIFTNTGRSKELIENIKVIRETPAAIITVTSHTYSPVAKLSDIVIGINAMETAYRNEPMEVRICQLFIVDVLFAGVALKKKELILNNLKKTRNSLKDRRVKK